MGGRVRPQRRPVYSRFVFVALREGNWTHLAWDEESDLRTPVRHGSMSPRNHRSDFGRTCLGLLIGDQLVQDFKTFLY